MTESDLARPIVVISDFETRRAEYELYSYGEETVVVPVREGDKAPSHKLAEDCIEAEMRKHCSRCSVDVISDNKCIVFVPEEEIKALIGVGGRNISGIEKKVGMSIDVKPIGETKGGEKAEYQTQITQTAVHFLLGTRMKGQSIDIYVDNDYLLTARAGKTGCLKVSNKNKIGKILVDAINLGEKIELFCKNEAVP